MQWMKKKYHQGKVHLNGFGFYDFATVSEMWDELLISVNDEKVGRMAGLFFENTDCWTFDRNGLRRTGSRFFWKRFHRIFLWKIIYSFNFRMHLTKLNPGQNLHWQDLYIFFLKFKFIEDSIGNQKPPFIQYTSEIAWNRWNRLSYPYCWEILLYIWSPK